DERGVALGPRGGQRERARGRGRTAGRLDVVLHEDGDPVQGSAGQSGPPLLVEPMRDVDRVRVDGDHGSEVRVDASDAFEVRGRDRRGRELAGVYRVAQLRDRLLGELGAVDV